MLQKERHLTPENPPRFPAARAAPETAQATPAQSQALLSLRRPLPGVTRALMGAETRARLAGRTPTPRCWFCLQARMSFVPFFLSIRFPLLNVCTMSIYLRNLQFFKKSPSALPLQSCCEGLQLYILRTLINSSAEHRAEAALTLKP